MVLVKADSPFLALWSPADQLFGQLGDCGQLGDHH